MGKDFAWNRDNKIPDEDRQSDDDRPMSSAEAEDSLRFSYPSNREEDGEARREERRAERESDQDE